MNPITRRDFLKASGSLVVSVTVPGAVAMSDQGSTLTGKPPLMPDELDSWIAVLPDGSVTAFFGKTEMGQGVDVAIAQIVADELDVAFDKVKVVMGDTAVTCNQGGASGSTGIQFGGIALRNAAAEARRVLVELGAKKLGVPVAELKVENGVVMVPGYALQRVSYGELIGGRHFHHKLEWNKRYGNPLEVKGAAKPKAPSEYKVVGKSFPQKVITEKVMGRERYVTDVRVEGMLHARVIRPPNAGCNPVAVDDGSIKSIPGARVVREKDFLAVVADREWDAVRAAESLKVTWSGECAPFPPMEKLHQYIREAKPNGSGAPVDRGDVDARARKGIASGHRRIRMAAAIARQHGAGLCGCRHGERRAAAVDGLAEAALRARRLRHVDRRAAGEGARDMGRRPRLVRPQRRRRCGTRRRAHLEIDRAHRAPAVHAPRRHRVGSQESRCRVPRPRRARCGGQRHRLSFSRQGILAPGRHPARRPSQGHPGRAS
jgi:hypothetical protein